LPPLSRIHTPVLEKLAHDLRFAPREALVRDVARVEELAGDIDPAGSYPEDFVIFRITGYRPTSSAPELLKGAALLADLSALAERMSEAAGMSSAELGTDEWVALDALAERWNVSRKTLDRWRREGLIARRVLGGAGRPALVVMNSVVERFAAGHGAAIARAGGFSRIPPELESRMLRRARVYRARFGCSLNQAAVRLAERFGRSPEAVRQLLKRHDARAAAERGEAVPDRGVDHAARTPGVLARVAARARSGVDRQADAAGSDGRAPGDQHRAGGIAPGAGRVRRAGRADGPDFLKARGGGSAAVARPGADGPRQTRDHGSGGVPCRRAGSGRFRSARRSWRGGWRCATCCTGPARTSRGWTGAIRARR
jgi:hypothetical protein